MDTRGIWLRANAASPWSPLAGWITEPDRPSGIGVVILPPVGYEASSSHLLWRRTAEALAADGALVLRVDVPGTGDSAGLLADINDLAPWRTALPLATASLRERGATRVVAVGAQLGASLALLDADREGLAGVVTVSPTTSGRQFVRTLTLLGLPTPDGGVAVAGHHFSPSLLAALTGLRSRAGDLPVVEIPDQPGVAAALQRPAEEASVDPGVVGQIVTAVHALLAPVPPGHELPLPAVVPPATRPPVDPVAMLTHHGVPVLEEFVAVGPDGLVGVLASPGEAREAADAVYVLVNSGSDPHSGPGRAWVELARHLAARGRTTLRLDLRGWGESPAGPTSRDAPAARAPSSTPGRPYDEHAVGDVVRAVEALADGRQRVVLGGLCAGAWVAIAAARKAAVAGVVVLNPQLYWQPGDPVEALLSTTHERRLSERTSIALAAADGRWDEEDARGLRPPAGRWLDDLVRLDRPTALLFAEGDDGLEYLQDRLGRRLRDVESSGVVTVTELVGVDHGLHRTWLRPQVYDAIAAELDRVLGPACLPAHGR